MNAHARLSIGHRLFQNIALQDVAVATMLGRLSYVALHDEPTVAGWEVRLPVLLLLALALSTIVGVRGMLVAPGPGRALLYRASMLGCIGGSYFALRPLLPVFAPKLLDAQLLRLDEILFGLTPAAWLDAFVSPASVEWFAFFYYSYYGLLALFLFGTLLFDDGQRRYELLLTLTLVMCIGHIGYTFVPGAGPYDCPGLHFQHSLQGGQWWARVERAVRTAGARYDIFPSLHTAISVAIAAHAMRHRQCAPFRYVWCIVCFWVGNIVVATVFLRWHYGVDLLAGFALAFTSQAVAVRLWRREGRSRAQNVWEGLLPEGMPSCDRNFIMGIFTIQMIVCVVLLASS